MRKLFTGIILAAALLAVILSYASVTTAQYSDSENAGGNTLVARKPYSWIQSTQADFNSGELDNVDVFSSPDNIILSRVAAPTLLTSNNAEVYTEAKTYQLEKTLNFTRSNGSPNYLRFDTNLKANKHNNSTASLRININDITQFTHTTSLSNYVSFSDQLDFRSYANGSYTLKLYLKIDKTNVSAHNSVFEIYSTTGSYAASGTIASRVLDSGASGSKWNALFWEAALPANTSLTLAVRASNSSFNKADATPAWNTQTGNSPLLSGLPGGRFKQWRAGLSTTDSTTTPVLEEVRLYYFP